jgi:hypothetical protein
MAFETGAVVGAIVGAGFTAGFSVWAANGLDHKRDCRRLIVALARVNREVKENATRPVQTLGDWEATKDVLSELALRPRSKPLWDALADAYRMIWEARSGMQDAEENPVAAPQASELTRLSAQLEAEQAELQREARLPLVLRWLSSD